MKKIFLIYTVGKTGRYGKTMSTEIEVDEEDLRYFKNGKFCGQKTLRHLHDIKKLPVVNPYGFGKTWHNLEIRGGSSHA